MLLGTCLLLARLHRSTLVTALATDSARAVAEAPAGSDPADVIARAERELHRVLGPAARLDWTRRDGTIRLRVRVPSPPVPGLGSDIVRVVEVRREQTR